MPVLVVETAVKRFANKKQTIVALDRVSLSIESGQIVGLLGPNGAGKTTLISAICGLLELDEGRIRVLEKDVVSERDQALKNLNLVTGFAGLLNELSVSDLMRYYAMLYGVPNAKKEIETALTQAGLLEKAEQTASTFSFGYRQCFYIAKALLSKPKLLFLDEPTVGLDVIAARSIRALIKDLRAKGLGILLTTHYMAEAEELCDDIHLIHKGKILAHGTANELKQKAKAPTLEDAFVALSNETWSETDDE